MARAEAGETNGSAQRRIAVTCGDPAGVGPEVIEGALGVLGPVDDITLVGSAQWVNALAARFGCAGCPVGGAEIKAIPGTPSAEGARIAFAALEQASLGTIAGDYDAVVTGPIAKSAMAEIGFSWPGHTEYFAERWGGAPTMGFVGRELRVVLATWHIPLREVPAALNPETLGRAVERAGTLCRGLGISRPRIAVCGLNPHAGEGGLLGGEERDWMNGSLDALRGAWPGLSECLPGDTAFFRHRNGEFDVVVAAYHDQGLAPLKLLEFESAVNVTLGLRHLRTSPDHGTAFGIAGQGRANASSMVAAIELARRLRADLSS